MVKDNRNRVVTNDMKALRALCSGVRRRVIKRINNETLSVRKGAKKMGISHPTLLSWIENPEKRLSRKLMKRIVLRMTKPKKKKILVSGPCIGWNRHGI